MIEEVKRPLTEEEKKKVKGELCMAGFGYKDGAPISGKQKLFSPKAV